MATIMHVAGEIIKQNVSGQVRNNNITQCQHLLVNSMSNKQLRIKNASQTWTSLKIPYILYSIQWPDASKMLVKAANVVSLAQNLSILRDWHPTNQAKKKTTFRRKYQKAKQCKYRERHGRKPQAYIPKKCKIIYALRKKYWSSICMKKKKGIDVSVW